MATEVHETHTREASDKLRKEPPVRMLSLDVRDGNEGTLDEAFEKTRGFCAALFEKAGWRILPGESKTKGDLLAWDFTYEIEPAGQLVITSDRGYRGDPDFVWVKIEGWDSEDGGADRVDQFLSSLDGELIREFGTRIGVSIIKR